MQTIHLCASLSEKAEETQRKPPSFNHINKLLKLIMHLKLHYTYNTHLIGMENMVMRPGEILPASTMDARGDFTVDNIKKLARHEQTLLPPTRALSTSPC
jgi:hypothetical protein